MVATSLVFVGGTDAGKTNFICRLWMALQAGDGLLKMKGVPQEIGYVESAIAHIHQGKFAPRTDKNVEVSRTSMTFTVMPSVSGEDACMDVFVPDVHGEVWENAVATSELPEQWMAILEGAAAAMLFVRVGSESIVQPLDWVASHELMALARGAAPESKMPTQVMLCELLRFLELKLQRDDGDRPRVVVLVTAWDRVDQETAAAGPGAYLLKQYPLFAHRISNTTGLEVGVFAASILGGDPEADGEFCDRLLDVDPATFGSVWMDQSGDTVESKDFTMPLAWALKRNPDDR